MRKDFEKYFREIDKHLSLIPKRDHKTFIKELRGNVADYLEENPTACLDDIELVFGTPAQVVDEFLVDVKSQRFLDSLNRKNIIRIMAVTIALIATVLAAIFVVDTINFNHGYGMNSNAQAGHSATDPNAIETY